MACYVLKVNGDKIRSFKNKDIADTWAKKYAHGKVDIVKMNEGKLPKASIIIKPKFDDLRYKPFTPTM